MKACEFAALRLAGIQGVDCGLILLGSAPTPARQDNFVCFAWTPCVRYVIQLQQPIFAVKQFILTGDADETTQRSAVAKRHQEQEQKVTNTTGRLVEERITPWSPHLLDSSDSSTSSTAGVQSLSDVIIICVDRNHSETFSDDFRVCVCTLENLRLLIVEYFRIVISS